MSGFASTPITPVRREPDPSNELARLGPTGWRAPFWFVGVVLARVFRDPVVYGRLRRINWPTGLGLMATLAVGGYLVAVLLAVLAPWLRQWLPLGVVPDGTMSAPGPLMWLVLALIMLALALLQTGTLHGPWWARVGGLIVSQAGLVVLAGVGTHLGVLTQLIWLGGCQLALIIFQLVRWRASFRWWEFVVVTLIMTVALASSRTTVRDIEVFTAAGEVQFSYFVVAQLAFLAAPVALAAGFAVSQVAFATVVWTVDLARHELPRWVLLVALVLLLGWRAFEETYSVTHADVPLGTLIWPIVLFAAAAGVWWVVDRLARAITPGPTRIADLREDLRHLVSPIAVLVATPGLVLPLITTPLRLFGNAATTADLPIGPTLVDLAQVISSSTILDTVFEWAAVVVMLGAALVLAAHGNRGAAELVALTGLIAAAMNLSSLRYATTRAGLWAVAILVVITIVLAVRRRLTPARIQALLVAAAVATLMSVRDFFDDPANVLLSGTAALFLGLIWNLLTSGDDANGDSPGWPRATRVCLVLASALFGMSVLAYSNLGSGMDSATDTLEINQAMGDVLFGNALLIGAFVVLLGMILRDRDLGSSAELEAVAVHPSSVPLAEPPLPPAPPAPRADPYRAHPPQNWPPPQGPSA
ncbi:hypothetical protein ACQBAR_10950 [Propionibacteriaceae bacterium Y1685]